MQLEPKLVPPKYGAKVGKAEVVIKISKIAGLENINPWTFSVEESISTLRGFFDFVDEFPDENDQSNLPDFGIIKLFSISEQVLATSAPNHLTEIPYCFDNARITQILTNPVNLYSISNGIHLNLSNSPLIFSDTPHRLIRSLSGKYHGLMPFYDIDFKSILQNATSVSGNAILIPDDIQPINFCHWLVDWLPRLATIGFQSSRSDMHVIVPRLRDQYQFETLDACGFSRDRILEVDNFCAIKATNLLVVDNLETISHPANRGAPWAIQYLRSQLNLGAKNFSQRWEVPPRKLYISRSDAAGRRILNDDAFFQELRKFGYHFLTLSGLSIFDQISIFSRATHIVGMHGAGLYHIVFCPKGATLIEIFPSSYGTSAFFELATSMGTKYYSYQCNNVISNSRKQLDDVIIDISDFLALSKAVL